MKLKQVWSVSDISNSIPMRANVIEFQDLRGEWHDFIIVATPERIVFGGACNVGFLESGFLVREDGESLEESLSETIADLETFYNYGPGYVSRIVCNERM